MHSGYISLLRRYWKSIRSSALLFGACQRTPWFMHVQKCTNTALTRAPSEHNWGALIFRQKNAALQHWFNALSPCNTFRRKFPIIIFRRHSLESLLQYYLYEPQLVPWASTQLNRRLFFINFQLRVTYSQLYGPTPILSLSYRKICGSSNFSTGAANAIATRDNKTKTNFILFIFYLIKQICF